MNIQSTVALSTGGRATGFGKEVAKRKGSKRLIHRTSILDNNDILTPAMMDPSLAGLICMDQLTA